MSSEESGKQQQGQPLADDLVSSANPLRDTFPMAVREKGDFYGRNEEIGRIRGILRATADLPIAIIGERGVGKTSLLNRTRRMLEEEAAFNGSFLFFALEPKSIACAKDFAFELWDGLSVCLARVGLPLPPVLAAPFHFDTYTRFASQMSEIQAQMPGKTFVVFIDEFDQILHLAHVNNLEYERIMGLMHYIVEETSFPMVFFLSLLKKLPYKYGSPISKDSIVLRPFNRLDADLLAQGAMKGLAVLDRPCLDWIYEFSGGHPFILKLLLTKLWERDPAQVRRKITLEMLAAAGEDTLRSRRAGDLLEDIYNTYMDENERYILLWMARSGDALKAEEVDAAGIPLRKAVNQLVERDYLVQRGNSYHFRIRFMGAWLRSYSGFYAELERLHVVQVGKADPPRAESKPALAAQVAAQGVCIDLSTQRLYMDGKAAEDDLPDLAYRALLFLAERAGQVVSKDELANHLYPGELYQESDERLSTLVYRIRQAIHDHRPYQYLETLPKRGLRLQNVTIVRTVPRMEA